MDRKLVAGIDLGGTKILTGIADSYGNLLAETRLVTAVSAGPDEVVNQIARSVKELLRQAGAEEGELSAVIVGAPGPLSPDSGIIHQAPNLGWRDYPFRQRLAGHFGAPVHLDNDANLAALGEYRYGYRGRWSDMLYMTVGTGVGGGIIINGHIYYGVSGGAGEFGHTVVFPEDGPPCRCGSRGCLETVASGTAIARWAREMAREGRAKALMDLAGGQPENITAEMVAKAARAGDAPALEVIGRAGYYLGIGLANLVSIFNPPAVVMGGGVIAGMGELMIPAARIEMKKRVMKVLGEGVEVLPAVLGNRAGLMGCFALAETLYGQEQRRGVGDR